MCNPACLAFLKQNLRAKEIKGRFVLDVGARNLNGSARDLVMPLKPKEYVGVDLEAGPGVDLVEDATNLIQTFGEEIFDVVITTEMLEHVEDWRAVIHNIKGVMKPGAVLYITTRSKGFQFHAYPGDFWRYELADMRAIFEDFEITVLESDPTEPGVFMKAFKPEDFMEVDLSSYELYSMKVQPSTPSKPEPPHEDKPPHVWGIA